VVATVSPTTTVPFVAPVATGANVTLTSTQAVNSSGLSGGAIAGIVIGVLLGLFLLFLLCLLLCFRAAFDGLRDIFGLGKKKTTRRRETVEVYSHGSRANERRWYGGDRPSRPERPKDSGGLGWGGVAAGLGGLAVLLGLKRSNDRKKKNEKSNYSGSSYTYSYDTETESE